MAEAAGLMTFDLHHADPFQEFTSWS
jgi:hypothetical protein